MSKPLILWVLLCAAVFLAGCSPISDLSFQGGEEPPPEPPANTATPPPVTDPPVTEPPPPEAPYDGLFGIPAMNNPSAISAPNGGLYNLTEDTFIYGKGVDDRIYPSGAVKLLTALTMLEAASELDGDIVFVVGDEIGMISQGSGVAGLVRGMSLSVESVLTALLIPVGNDAAYTVSVNTARLLTGSDTENNKELNDYFLRLMNDYALRIGCGDSNFSNPDGFHAGDNYSTLRDLMLISAYAAENPLIAEICGKREHQVRFISGESMLWYNSNAFLDLDELDIRGLRTGYTRQSGYSAQIYAFVGDAAYIAAVSGCETAEGRERDIINLLEMISHGYDGDIISAVRVD